MTRPASPGDRCFLIRDPHHDGKNLGKTGTVLTQCRCDPADWEGGTLEPWWVYAMHGSFAIEMRCGSGTCLCLPKADLRPIHDPDLETDNVSHPAPTERQDADHPATR